MKRNGVRSVVVGDRITVTLEVPGDAVLAREDGIVEVAMPDRSWRGAARDVLNEINFAEKRLPGPTRIARIRKALHSAARVDSEPAVERVRFVSSVIHRLGDLVLGCAITELSVWWKNSGEIEVRYSVDGANIVDTVRLGVGVVGYQADE